MTTTQPTPCHPSPLPLEMQKWRSAFKPASLPVSELRTFPHELLDCCFFHCRLHHRCIGHFGREIKEATVQSCPMRHQIPNNHNSSGTAVDSAARVTLHRRTCRDTSRRTDRWIVRTPNVVPIATRCMCPCPLSGKHCCPISCNARPPLCLLQHASADAQVGA